MSSFFNFTNHIVLCLFFAHTANSLDFNTERKRIHYKEFINTNMTKANFSQHDLRSVHFIDTDLTDADFSNSILSNVTFKNVKLAGANFDGATFYESRFDDCPFFLISMNHGPITAKVTNFQKTNLEYVKFTDCDLSAGNFSDAVLKHVSFTRSNISSTNFSKAVLRNNYFGDTTMISTIFREAKLFFPSFYRTLTPQSLNGADFRKAKLVGADFSVVDLDKANFSKAALSDVCFPLIPTTLTRISKAKVYNNCSGTIPDGVQLLSLNPYLDLDLIERSVSPYEEYNSPLGELDG